MAKTYTLLFISCLLIRFFPAKAGENEWIRINQLGYEPAGIKVAVWASKSPGTPKKFQLIDASTGMIVFTGSVGKKYGSYGPFAQCLRLNFSSFNKEGNYILKCGTANSPAFRVAADVYDGAADFALGYMRQQRSGFNPFLKDSCHTTDGYTMYGPMKDTTRINAWGGWHDASDYLQYVTTSANATYHLLAAYRDFPGVFADNFSDNGSVGKNGIADVLDEAAWGLKWLLKMHPRKDWMFNQLADDRDHTGFRSPVGDTANYGLGQGKGRPVYFATGEPQGLGKYENRSTGVASTAGKFSSAFSLAAQLYKENNEALSALYKEKALSAYRLGELKPGVCQTAPCRAPYFYEEDNWVDDMGLASASLFQLTNRQEYFEKGFGYSKREKVTPWMGADTAGHYQWYPFHNFAHYELFANASAKDKAALISFYREGIERVWKKASANGFFRGIPYIWCSNNLTVSFAIQCYLYRKMSGDKKYTGLEQSCFDWLFGCNPWGTSMVYGLPSAGDTPRDPHSSLSYLFNYPLDGGLVDGPVYTSIYQKHKIVLLKPDEYEAFQSGLAVYHDDVGDYTSNEPTMDGTASLIYLLALKQSANTGKK